MASLIPGVPALADISVSAVQSRRDRQRAQELLRSVYIRKGLLDEDVRRLPVLPQACSPGSVIFVAKDHDEIVGTITFYMDSAIGLPIDGVHRAEIDQVRERFGRIAEVGSLAVRENRRYRGIVTMLFLMAFRCAVVKKIECIVACVNPSYRRVYSRLLGFGVLGQCREHTKFLGSPSIPIGLDLSIQAPRLNGKDLAASDPLRKLLHGIDPARAFADPGSAGLRSMAS
jgi:hypothetical protein